MRSGDGRQLGRRRGSPRSTTSGACRSFRRLSRGWKRKPAAPDPGEIKGQKTAKRALENAAAAGHYRLLLFLIDRNSVAVSRTVARLPVQDITKGFVKSLGLFLRHAGGTLFHPSVLPPFAFSAVRIASIRPMQPAVEFARRQPSCRFNRECFLDPTN